MKSGANEVGGARSGGSGVRVDVVALVQSRRV